MGHDVGELGVDVAQAAFQAVEEGLELFRQTHEKNASKNARNPKKSRATARRIVLAYTETPCLSSRVEQTPPVPATFDALPVFPLSGTVLFPNTVLPLHIFEPRYRDMVSDALASDRLIAVVLAKGSTEPGDSPDVHEVAGCGRIIHHEKLPDGRYNILVQGLARVRLITELPLQRHYRRFTARVIARPDENDMSEAKSELAKLQSCVLSLRTLVAERDQPLLEVLRSTSDPIDLSDILAASVISTPALQQQVLETVRFKQRLAVLIDALADVMLQISEPSAEQTLN